MIIDSLSVNPDINFFDIIPKYATYFQENPYGHIKYLQINRSYSNCLINKIPKIMV